MNASGTAESYLRGGGPCLSSPKALWFLACVGLTSFFLIPTAHAAFIYESANEFLTSGDFNGDGQPDVLVLDKATGNARVGYSDAAGNLTWSAPLVTGVDSPTGCAVGPLLQATRDALAVTAPDLNRINLVDLSNPNTAPAPTTITSAGLGPHTLVTLPNPLGGNPPAFNGLLAASSDNNAPSERLDLMNINNGAATAVGQFPESGPFDRGNALQLSVTPDTFAVGLVRGPTDTLDIWQFSHSPDVMLSLTNLPSGSDYSFGRFNGETLPRFLFYQPGGSNVTVLPLVQVAGGFGFGGPVSVSVNEPIQGVFYVDSNGDGSAIVQFSDGVQGLRLPGGTRTLASVYRTGTGTAGNVFTGVVPLGKGNFALLDSPPGSSSVHAQVIHFDGSNYAQLSSSNLPSISSTKTRANLWLFQSEPFVNSAPGFLALVNAPDWTDLVNGLPGALTVSEETDSGTSLGLRNPTTSNLGSPPTGAAFALPNQYRDVISLFSYGSPQPPEPVTVNIAPPPGLYGAPISVSFTTLNPADRVFYRVGAPDTWHPFSGAFVLTNDSVVQYYGTNAALAARSRLQSASYTLGHNGLPTPTLNLNNGTSTTNPPAPPVTLPGSQLSSGGTLFYGRRSANNQGTIWAINLDGSNDSFITQGARPRVSRDGRWMAFLREGNPFNSQGNVWIRDLETGDEQRIFSNPDFVVCYDWLPDDSALITDFECEIGRLQTNGTLTPILTADCYDDAPVLDPAAAHLAFHNVNPNSDIAGLYVSTATGANRARIVSTVPGATWASWAPDGQHLAFVSGNSSSSLDLGVNLWTVHSDGSSLRQITGFNDGTNGFPHGALWAPSGQALVGAGTIFGTNGLWVLPLSADLTQCVGLPTLLPTSPGDPIDFAGSIIAAAPVAAPAELFVRLAPEVVTVYWSTNIVGAVLESSPTLSPPAWTAINPPYTISSGNYEHQILLSNLSIQNYFRLHILPAP